MSVDPSVGTIIRDRDRSSSYFYENPLGSVGCFTSSSPGSWSSFGVHAAETVPQEEDDQAPVGGEGTAEDEEETEEGEGEEDGERADERAPSDVKSSPPSLLPELPAEPPVKGMLSYFIGVGVACCVIVLHSFLVEPPSPTRTAETPANKTGISSLLRSFQRGQSSSSGQRSSKDDSTAQASKVAPASSKQQQGGGKRPRGKSKNANIPRVTAGPLKQDNGPAKIQRAKNRQSSAAKADSSAADVYDDEAFEALLAKMAGGRGDSAAGDADHSEAGDSDDEIDDDSREDNGLGDGDHEIDSDNDDETSGASGSRSAGVVRSSLVGEDDEELMGFDVSGRDPDSSRYSSSPDGSRGPTPVSLESDGGGSGDGVAGGSPVLQPAAVKKSNRKGSVGSTDQPQRTKRSPSSSLAVGLATTNTSEGGESVQCSLCRQRYTANNRKKMCDECSIPVCERCSGRYKYKYLGWSQARRICKPCNVKAQEQVAQIRQAGLQSKSLSTAAALPAAAVGSVASGPLAGANLPSASSTDSGSTDGIGGGPVSEGVGWIRRLVALLGVVVGGRRGGGDRGQETRTSVCSISFLVSLMVAVGFILLLRGGDLWALVQFDLLLIHLTTGVFIVYMCSWAMSSARQPRKKQKIQ